MKFQAIDTGIQLIITSTRPLPKNTFEAVKITKPSNPRLSRPNHDWINYLETSFSVRSPSRRQIFFSLRLRYARSNRIDGINVSHALFMACKVEDFYDEIIDSDQRATFYSFVIRRRRQMGSIKDSSSLECVTRALKANHRERRWLGARFQGNPSRVDFVFHFFNWKRDRTVWLPLHLCHDWLWLHHQFRLASDNRRAIELSTMELSALNLPAARHMQLNSIYFN